MELIDNFNTKSWAKGNPSEQSGFAHYRIAKCYGQEGKVEEGKWKYAVFDDEGDMKMVYLFGGAGKRDPLFGVVNLQFKIDDSQSKITGVIIEDECVLSSA